MYDDQGNPQFAAYPGGLNRNEVEVGFLGSQGFDWHQYYFYVKPKPGHTFSNLNQWYISTNVSSMEHDSQGGFIIRTAVGHYTIVSTVPEPATFSILIFGVLALLYRRK